MSGRKSFKIHFDSGTHARTVTVKPDDDPKEVRARLRLSEHDHALLMHAGAGGATADLLEQLKPTFREVLAPLAQKHQIAVLDGATRAGFVGMMGKARAEIDGTFPLIGVAPLSGVQIPGGPNNGERFPLDDYHSHFVLVKDGGFGVESHMLIGLGKALARHPVALFINGGEVSRREVLMHARSSTPILVLAGSGRLADEIVDALKRGTSDDLLKETLRVGHIRVCTPDSLAERLTQMLSLEV
jgi:hypothetical protein